MIFVYKGMWWNGKIPSRNDHLLNRPYIVDRPIVSLYGDMDGGLPIITADLLLAPSTVGSEEDVIWLENKPDEKYNFMQRHFKKRGHNFLLEYEDGFLRAKDRTMSRAKCVLSVLEATAPCKTLKKPTFHIAVPEGWPFPEDYYGPFTLDEEYNIYYQSYPPEYTSTVWTTTIALHHVRTNEIEELLRIEPAAGGIKAYYSDGYTYKEEFLLLMNRLSNPIEDHIMHGFSMIDPIFRVYYDLWNGVAYQFVKTGEKNGSEAGRFEKLFDFKGLKKLSQHF